MFGQPDPETLRITCRKVLNGIGTCPDGLSSFSQSPLLFDTNALNIGLARMKFHPICLESRLMY